VFFVLAGPACQQSGGPKTAELRGAVQKNETGFYIMSGGKRYVIEGQDLTAMVGKMVTMEGTVTENAGKYTITVTKVTE
jgi:hypothetical protein